MNGVELPMQRKIKIRPQSKSEKFQNWLRTALRRDSSPYFLRHMGVDICVDPSIFSKQVIAAIRRGSYERKEATQLLSLVGPGETILEIGAGCGFLSTLMAKQPDCKSVHAVEANPALIPIIKATHMRNEVDVTLYNEVLGQSNGEAEFFINENFWASGLDDSLGRRSLMIKQVAIQERIFQIRPTLIVCDIEGGEANLLGDADLAHTDKVLFELHPRIIGQKGVRTVFEQMSKRGFTYDCFHSSGAIVTFIRPKKLSDVS